jgi:glycine/sarcosine N-methyltransferase
MISSSIEMPMHTAADAFYDDLAPHYHLIFEDWNRSIERQATILGPLLEQYTGQITPRVLDCACGIGTQTLGLSMRGHRLIASDISRASVIRAKREAFHRGLTIPFHVADMRDLSPLQEADFDAVLVADNALPHLLHRQDRERALCEIVGRLRPGGILLATIRDYDRLIQTRPATQPPSFYGSQSQRRIVHQIWDWEGDEYDVHLYLSMQTSQQWTVKHYVSRYYALLRNDLEASLHLAGFTSIQWLEQEATSFYQPIVIARK